MTAESDIKARQEIRNHAETLASRPIFNISKTLLSLAAESLIRPRWAYYRARGFYFNYYRNEAHRSRLDIYEKRKQPLHDAIATVTGASSQEVFELSRGKVVDSMLWRGDWVVDIPGHSPACEDEEGPIELHYGPSPELMRVAYIVCRILQPKVVFETGVAKGFSSAAILDALDNNGSGRLHSVELPSLHFGYTQQVGQKIPDRLRSRWSLHLGPSAVVLPRLLREFGEPGVCLYDSAGSYDNQVTEYSIVLRHMKPGSVLISDLLKTDAFAEAAESCDCIWTTTEQTKQYPIGLLRKLG